MARITKAQILREAEAKRQRQQYMTPDNIALIDAAKTMAANYQAAVNAVEIEAEKHLTGAEPSLIDALAKVYALAMAFEFDPKGSFHAMPSYMLLTELGAKPPKHGDYRRPILTLVQALFSNLHNRHRSQPSRYAKVIEFLIPSAEERTRLHNLTPAGWADLFLTKYKSYGSLKQALRAQQKQQAQTQKQKHKATTDAQTHQHEEYAQRQQQYQEKARRKFFKREPDIVIPNQTDLGENAVVLLRREGDHYNLFKLFDHPAIADALLLRRLGWGSYPIPEADSLSAKPDEQISQ